MQLKVLKWKSKTVEPCWIGTREIFWQDLPIPAIRLKKLTTHFRVFGVRGKKRINGKAARGVRRRRRWKKAENRS
jgi:hypothetical protein